MSTITVFGDVQKGAKPPIPESDEDWVNDLIAEAEGELSTRLGDLNTWVTAAGADKVDYRKSRIRLVVKRIVRRVTSNPLDLSGETDGDYGYQRRGRSRRDNRIFVTPADWRLLGISVGRPKTIRVGLPSWSPRNMT